jgi:hypothetical protein
VAGGWWLVAGGWWLVAGGWWLVAGGWWLVAGGWWKLHKSANSKARSIINKKQKAPPQKRRGFSN